MKVNKKWLQMLAALWILAYHTWVPLTDSIVEQYLLRIGYVGVDIFFFLSAYSLADKELKYGSFVKDRFLKIYSKFLLFLVVATLAKHWSFLRAVKAAVFVEFFQKGGGAFLWFLPAILIFYVLYPLFMKWQGKGKVWIVLGVWLVLSLVSDHWLGYSKIFIFTNRLPVILLGYWLKKNDLPKWSWIAALPVGLVLLYFFGFQRKLNIPFADFYYVPTALVVIGIVGMTQTWKPGKVVHLIGNATLEVYALQMIWGAQLASKIYRWTGSALVTDLLNGVIMVGVSVLLSLLFQVIEKKSKMLMKQR